MSMNSMPIEYAAPVAADSGLSNLEIYAILLAIGLLLTFVVLVVIMRNVIAINKKMNSSLSKETIPSAEEKPVAMQNKQPAMAQNKVYCPTCGAELFAGASFCDKCGTKMQ